MPFNVLNALTDIKQIYLNFNINSGCCAFLYYVVTIKWVISFQKCYMAPHYVMSQLLF